MALTTITSALPSVACPRSHPSSSSFRPRPPASLRLRKLSGLALPLRRSPRVALTEESPPSPTVDVPPSTLLKEIPGSYGPPLIGALRDRLNYFWFQGRDEFFLSLMKRYNSTVIRLNMPPGPPFFPDGRTVMLLDQKSIQVLYDVSKVEKTDVFAGTYMPSTDFTGGFRVLPYLDPSEEKHTLLKNFCFEMLRSNGKKWLPEFHKAFDEAGADWEAKMAKTGSADFGSVSEQFTFNFLCRSILGRDPAAPGKASLGTNGPTYLKTWILLQLAPQTSIGLPKLLEEIFLHTFPLPFALASSEYSKVFDFLRVYGKEVLEMAVEKFGLDKEEACHNLLFFMCFNTWGGFRILFLSVIQRLGAAGQDLQAELVAEVRGAVEAHGGLTMKAIASMELLDSAVYEVLRIDPPVPFQYGHAKEDLTVESHDAVYRVKKGELLGGYQKISMRDPRVFTDSDNYNPKRFMGDKGKALLQGLTWSNGPETDETSTGNKQCAGKDFVIMVARLLVAEFFLRYDYFALGSQSSPTFTVLKKRSVANVPSS